MKQIGLSYFTETHLTSIGLLAFLFAFLMVLFWTFRKGSTSVYKQVEQLPFEESQSGEQL